MAGTGYFSSSQNSAAYGYTVEFGWNGYVNYNSKQYPRYVRAVRAF